MTTPDDVIRRVYVHIKQVAENPPEAVDMMEVDHYHRLLDRLDSVGWDTSNFRINPATDMYYPVAGWNLDGNITYSPGKVMDSDWFARQVRALLLYFEVREKPVIFTVPKNEGL